MEQNLGFSAPPVPGLRQQLQHAIQSRPEWWVYSIFWHASRDGDGRSLRLSWGDGHFRGPKPNPNTIGDGANMMDELEWFYTLSVIGLLATEDDLVALSYNSGSFIWLAGDHEMGAYRCKRAKEGHSSGVKTFVCVSTVGGIVELGSSEVINPDLGLIHLCKSIGVFTETVSLPAQAEPSLNPSSSELDKLSTFSISNDGLEEEEEREDYAMEIPVRASSSSEKRKKKRATPAMSYLEAERGRRAKLNDLFCALRGVVPNVSKMDRASLLHDAVTYIRELKTRVNELENRRLNHVRRDGDQQIRLAENNNANVDVNVKVVGSEAILRVMSRDVNFPAAGLMDALRQMELQICFATISTVKGVMIQDVVVRAPNGLSATHLKTALQTRLLQFPNVDHTSDL